MIWKILLRIAKKHLALHLAIPLMVGLLAHLVSAHYFSNRPLEQVVSDLWSLDTLILVSGILAAYFVVMYVIIARETSIRIVGPDLAVLHGRLSNARKYFATSTIAMSEWFDPVSQIFLATIIGQKVRRRELTDNRVLLLARPGEVSDLDSPYLDGYYAQRLAEIHMQYQTPLGFLRRAELFQILEKLSFEERRALHCCPRRLTWLPGWMLYSMPLLRVRRNLPELDFALVESESGETCVLKVSKRGQNVHIEAITDTLVAPYAKFIGLIRDRVYKAGGQDLDESHDFIKIFHPICRRS